MWMLRRSKQILCIPNIQKRFLSPFLMHLLKFLMHFFNYYVYLMSVLFILSSFEAASFQLSPICPTHTPLCKGLVWKHPSKLHRLRFAPCLTHTLPLTTWFVQPLFCCIVWVAVLLHVWHTTWFVHPCSLLLITPIRERESLIASSNNEKLMRH